MNGIRYVIITPSPVSVGTPRPGNDQRVRRMRHPSTRILAQVTCSEYPSADQNPEQDRSRLRGAPCLLGGYRKEREFSTSLAAARRRRVRGRRAAPLPSALV